MASLSMLCFFISFFAIFSQSQSDAKVSLELYYESLCPYSANFIVNFLPKIFKPDIFPIVDLKLVPWGNAKLRPNNTFQCQHGPDECLLNTVEACAIHAWPEVSKHFGFIICVEDLVYKNRHNDWKSCFQTLALDSKPIDQCYQGKLGKQLELQYAAETNALKPSHEYVPWVVVDGKPLYEDYENFLRYICDAYKGNPTPKSCAKKSYHSELKAKPKHSVCEKEREIPTWEKVKSTIASLLSKLNLGGAY